ncbi:MAG: formylmethanofuran dehydrogenase subunit A [Candidatus Bathyarchaeia archaeon]
MREALLIRNGVVYDPMNGVEGEVMDVAVEDGAIVEDVDERRAKIIDASGMLVMPGGVDIHSHIAGSKSNIGRLLRPEDHRRSYEPKTAVTRSGVGHTVPSTKAIGYRYARMGYTTVFEAASPPIKQKHTWEELNDIPIIDKAALTVMGNNWFIMDFISQNRVEDAAIYAAWLLKAVKGYSIKIVNPGGLEAWGFGRNVKGLDDPVPYFNVTPKEIVRGLCTVSKILGLPHTIHVHTNRLGQPGNYVTTIETMDCVKDLALSDRPVIHITHCQFSAFKGDSWANMRSGAEEIARYVNAHKHVTLDMGQVIFTDTTTMTADGPWQYTLYELSGNKWVNHDVEVETSSGIVPFKYRKKSYVHATMWSIGLELALLIKDPWKIYLTTDHPNGGPFTEYPQIICWLMSRKTRERILKKINRKARAKSLLPSIDRELTFYEIAIITRAGQAKALGLKNKGHLGVGADADIAIYNVNPRKIDPSADYKVIRKAFARAAYTIKSGEIVAKDGEIVKAFDGKTYWINFAGMSLASDASLNAVANLKKKFREYWTVEFDNYFIPERYLKASMPITLEVKGV